MQLGLEPPVPTRQMNHIVEKEGKTKTKARLANYLAKKRPGFRGVRDLRSPEFCNAVYPTILLNEVWGIGRASPAKLQALSLSTVADLAAYNVN